MDVRNSSRRFKEIHKRFLVGYMVNSEYQHNQCWITPEFIVDLVRFHSFYPCANISV